MAERTDEDLAAAIGTDPEALAPLIARYWGRAYGLAYQITRDTQTAEDAAQDAFVRLVRAGGSYQEGRAFRPWFLRVVANSAKDQFKASDRRRRYEERAARRDEAAAADGADQETLDALVRALEALDVDQRMAITLHYLEGMTFKEVAETVECPPGTAASRVRRGLETLRGELKALAPAGAAFALLLKPALAVEAAPTPSPSKLRAAAFGPAAAGAAGLGAGVAAKALAGVTAVAAVSALVFMASSGGGGARDDGLGFNVPDDGAPQTMVNDGANDGSSGGADGSSDAGPTTGPQPTAPVPGRTVTVRVTYSGGPQEDVEVRFTRLYPGDGTLFKPGHRGEKLVARTNEQGEVLQALGPGPWELRLGPPPGLNVAPESSIPLALPGKEVVPGLLLTFEGEPQSWYGGDGEPRLLHVPKDTLSLDVAVPALAVARGRVVRDDDGVAIPGATVKVGTYWVGRCDDLGGFAVPFPASDQPSPDGLTRTHVGARAAGYSHGSVQASAADLAALTLRLRSGVELRGRVVLADGTPGANLMLELGSSEGMQLPLTTDAAGRFSAEGLNANRGDAYAAIWVYVKTAEHTHVFDLLLRPDHEHVLRLPEIHPLRGTVLLVGRPVDGVGVGVFERDGEPREIGSGTSGHLPRAPGAAFSFDEPEDKPASGLFHVDGLPAGPAWVVVGPYPGNDLDLGEDPETGVNAFRVDLPNPAPLTFEVEEPVDAVVRVLHGGQPARDARVRVFPVGGVEDAPALRTGYCDPQGAFTARALCRGASYDVVADLPDGREVRGPLRAGDPFELSLPGEPLPLPAELRFEAFGSDGQPLTLRPKVRVYAAVDPSRARTWEPEPGLSFEDDPPADAVPAVGDAWVVIGDWSSRAIRRVTLAPGAVVDLGRVDLERLPMVDLELAFDPNAVTLYQLVLEWKDPETGAPAEWENYKVLAPGRYSTVPLPRGRVTVEGRWRDGPNAPFQRLNPTSVDVDADGSQPLVIRIP